MIPEGTLVFPLAKGDKSPLAGSRGHLGAVPPDQLDLSTVPGYFNYGISLEEKYVLLDVDDPATFFATYRDVELPGWRQTTRRGFHVLFKGTGHGIRNFKIPGADVKVRGYLVGPGSVVDGTKYVWNGASVEQVPQWLSPLLEVNRAPEAVRAEIEPVTGVGPGEHDNFLHRAASWMRGQYGLDEPAIEAFLRAGPLAVLEGVDPSSPYTEADVKRIARSATRYAATSTEAGAALVGAPRTDEDVQAEDETVDFILPGFIPEKVLTVLYGDGKIGKSSFLSWLAARETRRGNHVIFVPSGEETFDQFVRRARLNGIRSGHLHEFVAPGALIPKYVPLLIEKLKGIEGHVSLICIDALYSHFGEGKEGENEAVRARSRLSVLAKACEENAVAILGTIHENAQGNLLGSREMRNVARSLIHAKGGKGRDFTIWSKGSNGWSPDYGVSFPGVAVPIVGPDGQQRVFEDIFGERVPQSIWKLELGEKVYGSHTEVNIDEVEVPIPMQIEEALKANPNLSNPQLAEVLEVSLRTIDSHAKEIRDKLGIVRNKGGRPSSETTAK